MSRASDRILSLLEHSLMAGAADHSAAPPDGAGTSAPSFSLSPSLASPGVPVAAGFSGVGVDADSRGGAFVSGAPLHCSGAKDGPFFAFDPAAPTELYPDRSVAQSGEHRIPNPKVDGSSPSRSASDDDCEPVLRGLPKAERDRVARMLIRLAAGLGVIGLLVGAAAYAASSWWPEQGGRVADNVGALP